MRGRRGLLPLLAVTGALAAPAAAGATPGATITEFSGGLTADSAPADIARGPDGNLWFTQQGNAGGIGSIQPDGTITEYTAGAVPGFSAGQLPSRITAGPDGAVWFTEEGATGQIARFDLGTKTVTEFPALTANAQPTGITTGPDGNVWFTENADPGRIGRIDPDTGTITELSAGLSANSGPNRILAAAGDKLYFTQASDPGRIGRIKADGKVEEYTAGLSANSRPTGIAEGGDGALWFTEGASPGRIGRLWPGTLDVDEFTGGLALDLTADAGPAGITRGADGNVWLTESAAPARIGRVTVPPLASMSTPEGASVGTVRLKARVAPNSQPTTYRFEWGPDLSYGERSPAPLDAGDVAGPVPVSSEVALTPDAHYHAASPR